MDRFITPGESLEGDHKRKSSDSRFAPCGRLARRWNRLLNVITVRKDYTGDGQAVDAPVKAGYTRGGRIHHYGVQSGLASGGHTVRENTPSLEAGE